MLIKRADQRLYAAKAAGRDEIQEATSKKQIVPAKIAGTICFIIVMVLFFRFTGGRE